MIDPAAVVPGCARPVDAGRRTLNWDSVRYPDRFSVWRSGAAGGVQPGARVVGWII